jgi:hypothetical protein
MASGSFHGSHDAVIRVYDKAGNVIETHEHKGRFQRTVVFETRCDAPPEYIPVDETSRSQFNAVLGLRPLCIREPQECNPSFLSVGWSMSSTFVNRP